MEGLRTHRLLQYTLGKFSGTNSNLSLRALQDELQNHRLNVSLSGGAYEAVELDGKHAINQASYLAASL